YVGDYDAEVSDSIASLEELDPHIVAEYNAKEVAYTFMLYEMLYERLCENVSSADVYYSLLIPAANVLAKMETTGVQIDFEGLVKLKHETITKRDELQKQMEEMVGEPFNPKSHKQVQKAMYETLQLPVVGQPKTDRATLKKVQEYTDNPFPRLLEDYRQVDK